MPAFLTPQFITSVVVILVVIHILLIGAAYQILLERKICAWTQDRCGPNRVGPLGLLQPIADGLKLLMKEDFTPKYADRTLFIIAPAITAFTAFIGFAVIPWAGKLDLSAWPLGLDLPEATRYVSIAAADVNIGVVYLIAVAGLSVYGVVLGGWATNNKFAFLGSMRAGAQVISYEIPMGVALLCVILTAGTIRPDLMIAQQLDGQWNILQQPLAAILFYVCMLAESNRTPFDLAETETELVGGWHTEYSSMKWTLFFLGEYVNLAVGGAFFALLFLGGWSINPFSGADLPMAGGLGLILLQFSIMLGKVFLVIFLTMLVRWTLPRFRFDQLMKLAWEGMIPASVVVLVVTSIMVFMGWNSVMWLGSLASLGLIWVLAPLLPRQQSPNQRIGLIGSRFSPAEDELETVGSR